jgi:hypothetical protein
MVVRTDLRVRAVIAERVSQFGARQRRRIAIGASAVRPSASLIPSKLSFQP